MVGVSFWENEKVPQMDGGDGCITVWVYQMPLNYTLKMVKIVTFIMYILTTIE